MSDTLYPTFAFLGFILVLIPLPWHLQAWNAGTCLFMVWTALGCLIHFINSIVWANNLELHSAPWCDISSKLIVGLSVALPCASLCINRRLYAIARISQVHATRAEKRRIVYIDLAIGVGFPIIIMALHYIVQGHRFDIFENIGCWPSTFNTPPAYPLVWMWPIVIGLISMTYCALSLHAFLRRRKEFTEFLATNPSLNMNRYFRLMALAAIEICTTTPFAIYFMYLNLTTVEISPWVSWSDTKWHFSRIDYVQAFFLNSQPLLKLNFNLSLWLFPGCAILFFAFFGFAEEARRNYKRFYYFLISFFNINLSSHSHKMIGDRQTKLAIVLPSMHALSGDETSNHGSKWEDLTIKLPDIAEYDSTLPSPTQLQNDYRPHVPALTITRPNSDIYSANTTDGFSNNSTQQPPSHRRVSSGAISRPPSFRRSISTDFGITVSPAFLPDSDGASRYHEEAFLTRDAPGASLTSDPLLHGGIRITVEKNISDHSSCI